MKTILEIIDLGESYLKKKDIERPRREAEELIAEALGLTRLSLYLDFERLLTDSEVEKCRQFFVRRGKREPFQYIVGTIPFAGVWIKVTKDVLIPRPETEQLVSKIIAELEKESLEGKILWDMCTGSGCIGISLKKRFPALTVVLSDLSEKALQIATENAANNNVQVIVYKGDMFNPMKNQMIDYFVSNPPYVTEEEYNKLSPEIRQYEPSSAFLAGVDGLKFYETISKNLSQHLKEKAWMEIGSLQKEAILSLFQEENWSECFVEADWSGKDRFLTIVK